MIPFKFKKIKKIWHHRDSFQSPFYNNLLPVFVDKVVCISNYVKSTLSNLHSNKAIVVYNGINTDDYYFSERNQVFTIGSFGRITEWKRFDLIIKAAHKFQEKYNIKDWKLNIFGDTSVDGSSEYELSLMKLVNDLDISKNVELKGATKEPLLKMSQSDVTVNFSKNEPFGRVIIESLIVSTPVICADSGGAPEIIKKTGGGLIARDGDIEHLADQLFKLY
ncbi:hypothetical protein CHH91_00025, partial [Virgibacillus sp. 7505]|uniref:glycosyltransferase family 4 protein n=1 Tax=Virgibacillus sp. 7505 TaxID=2022548 RepID=UPI000BC8E539